eukprot:g424.t1
MSLTTIRTRRRSSRRSTAEEKEKKGNGVILGCQHASSIDLQTSLKKLTNPVKWKCNSCTKTDDIWLCVTCGRIGCGRKHGGHAKDHFLKKNHPVVLSFGMKAFYCYACEDWCISDNSREELGLLRKILQNVQKDRFDAPRTRSGRSLGKESSSWNIPGRSRLPFSRDIKRNKRMDLKYTAGVMARNSLLTRCFLGWMRVSKENRSCGRVSSKKITASAKAETKRKRDDGAQNATNRKKGKLSENCTRLPGRVGLRNLGNSCYLNAVAQAISNTVPLRDMVLSFRERARAILARSSTTTSSSRRSGSSTRIAASFLEVKETMAPKSRRRQTQQVSANTKTTHTSTATTTPPLQLLSKPPPLRRLTTALCRAHSESSVNETCGDGVKISLLAELYSLLRVIWTRRGGRKSVVTPTALMHSVWHFIPRFRGYDQQDAYEFFIDLVDAIHDEFLRLYARRRTSKIHNLVRFAHTSIITCKRCNRESLSSGRSVCLSLSISQAQEEKSGRSWGRKRKRRNVSHTSQRSTDAIEATRSVSVLDCLRDATSSEILADGEKIYDCERCKTRVAASRRWVVSSYPLVLVLHIKRAKWLAGGGKKKVQSHVHFPLSGLDLSPFAAKAAGACATSGSTYDLSSVVVHRGRGIDTGHYSNYCFDHMRDTWLSFDDLSVRTCSTKEVGDSQAYLLFYVRRD